MRSDGLLQLQYSNWKAGFQMGGWNHLYSTRATVSISTLYFLILWVIPQSHDAHLASVDEYLVFH